MSSLYIVATNRAKPGCEDRLQQIFNALIEPTRQEPGCLQYNLYRGEDGKKFLFFEHWASPEALEAHRQSAHVATMKREAPALLDGPPEMKILEQIG